MASALLLLDFVTFIVDTFSSDRAVAVRAGELLKSARHAGVPVWHVVPASLEDGLHPAILPQNGEPVLSKRTIGAFGTTDLHDRLQRAGIDELLIAGVATSGTVLSTARWAYDIGYRVIICRDACADPDPQAHVALLDESVFSQSWLGLWRVASVLHTDAIEALHR